MTPPYWGRGADLSVPPNLFKWRAWCTVRCFISSFVMALTFLCSKASLAFWLNYVWSPTYVTKHICSLQGRKLFLRRLISVCTFLFHISVSRCSMDLFLIIVAFTLGQGKILRRALVRNFSETMQMKNYLLDLKCNDLCLILFMIRECAGE